MLGPPFCDGSQLQQFGWLHAWTRHDRCYIGFPKVRVPVLSSTTVSIAERSIIDRL